MANVAVDENRNNILALDEENKVARDYDLCDDELPPCDNDGEIDAVSVGLNGSHGDKDPIPESANNSDLTNPPLGKSAVIDGEGKAGFSCTLCGKIFNSKHHVDQHMIVHDDARPHVCPVCKFAFKRKAELTIHVMRKHLDDEDGEMKEKKFKCEECGKMFKTKFTRDEHTKHMHAVEEKLFECECGLIFKREMYLLKHRETRVHRLNMKSKERAHRALQNPDENLKICVKCNNTFPMDEGDDRQGNVYVLCLDCREPIQQKVVYVRNRRKRPARRYVGSGSDSESEDDTVEESPKREKLSPSIDEKILKHPNSSKFSTSSEMAAVPEDKTVPVESITVPETSVVISEKSMTNTEKSTLVRTSQTSRFQTVIKSEEMERSPLTSSLTSLHQATLPATTSYQFSLKQDLDSAELSPEVYQNSVETANLSATSDSLFDHSKFESPSPEQPALFYPSYIDADPANIVENHEPTTSNSLTKQFYCNVCPLSFTTRRLFEDHKLSHIKPFKCDYCPARHKTKKIMRKHVKRKHPECFIDMRCEKKVGVTSGNFTPSTAADAPIFDFSGDEEDFVLYPCDVCAEEFRNRQDCIRHVATHSAEDSVVNEEDLYWCAICVKSFKKQFNYNSHMKKKHSTPQNKAEFYCEICGEGFANKGKLLAHRLKSCSRQSVNSPTPARVNVPPPPLSKFTAKSVIAHKDKPLIYQCQTCTKRFPSMYRLQNHRRQEHPNDMRRYKARVPANTPTTNAGHARHTSGMAGDEESLINIHQSDVAADRWAVTSGLLDEEVRIEIDPDCPSYPELDDDVPVSVEPQYIF